MLTPLRNRRLLSAFFAAVGVVALLAPKCASLTYTGVSLAGADFGETALPVAIAADLPTTRRIAVNTPRTVGVSLQYQF